jgi:hypothetical protein
VLTRLSLLVALVLVGACSCGGPTLPDRPVQCTPDGVGCLIDEQCIDGVCVKLEPCEEDEDCPLVQMQCVFPAQICEFRPGFSDECNVDADCPGGSFCALGVCRALDDARNCARRSDCPIGQACSQIHFKCIPEGPCTLEEDFPETACGPDEVCEIFSERCSLSCQEECTVATELEDCGAGLRCDGACRCVQCLENEDCGLGLICNVRAGRCESEDLCFDDDDCPNPLVCDLETALCQVPQPPCTTDLDCDISELCNLNTGECEPVLGECFDDRFEDADTPTTARELDVPNDGTGLFLDELQLCPDDDDVYAVALDPGDNLIVRVLDTEIQARATAWLLDPTGEFSLRFALTPPFGDGTISYVSEVAETVYVRLNALEGPSFYQMELLRLPGTPCTPDVFEGDPDNDATDRATPSNLVLTDVQLAASICQEDVDFLAIDVGADEAVRVTLDFDGTQADLDLALVEPQSGAVLVASSGVLGTEQVFLRSPFARTVLARVQSFNRTAGPYQILVERLPPFVCADDAAEPDDDIAGATLVPLDTTLDEARTACQEDVDVLEVPLLDFQRLVAFADFPAAEMALTMTVTDDAGNVLATSPNGADGETLTFNARGDETVFLHVAPELNTKGAYQLTVDRENQIDCADDDLEPNDTLAAAPAAPAAQSGLTLCDLDEDLFQVQGVAGKRLRARIAFTHADGDLDLMLIGIDGEQTLATSDGVGDSEEADAILPVDGTYYVRVFSLSETPAARYSIEVALEDE